MSAAADPTRDAPDGVAIEPMRRRHLRSVARLEVETNPRPWSLRLFQSELRAEDSRAYFVARLGSRLVGFGGIMLVAGDAHVTNIAVVADVRRLGIGTRLLLELARRAIEEGAGAMTLEVRMSNRPAQELYRRFGFVPAGVRKNYYSDSNEDAIIMWATDIGTEEYRIRLRDIEAGLQT